MRNDNDDVSIFIITKDKQYIHAIEYDKDDDPEGVFVCLTNERLNIEYGGDNSICIHKEWSSLVKEAMRGFAHIDQLHIRRYVTPATYQLKDGRDFVGMSAIWQDELYRIPDNEQYPMDMKPTTPWNGVINGYMSCANIMSNIRPLLKWKSMEERIPAIMLAFHSVVDFGGTRLHGYLPAIKQLFYIDTHITTANWALSMIGSDDCFPMVQDTGNNAHLYGPWWSSTEGDSENAWYMFNGMVFKNNKSAYQNIVLPLFLI